MPSVWTFAAAQVVTRRQRSRLCQNAINGKHLHCHVTGDSPASLAAVDLSVFHQNRIELYGLRLGRICLTSKTINSIGSCSMPPAMSEMALCPVGFLWGPPGRESGDALLNRWT